MKRIINKVFLLIILSIFLVSLFNKNTNAKTADLDRIDEYIVTVDPDFNDGSLNIRIDVKWTVLNSTSEGPLTWVKIGIPNYHASNIKKLTPNIKKAKYYSDGGSFIRLDLDREYKAGETLDFSFSFNQSYMYNIYYVENATMINYNYNPGYFNDIVVTKATLRWNSMNVKEAPHDSYILMPDGYYEYSRSLDHGQRISINLAYDLNVFSNIDPKKTYTSEYEKYPFLFPLLIIGGTIGVVIFIMLLSRLTRDPYQTERGFYAKSDWYFWNRYPHVRYYKNGVSDSGKFIAPPRNVSQGGFHGGRSGGCACACACACAGGGRAGCSIKDFYHTNLKSKDIEKVLEDSVE